MSGREPVAPRVRCLCDCGKGIGGRWHLVRQWHLAATNARGACKLTRASLRTRSHLIHLLWIGDLAQDQGRLLPLGQPSCMARAPLRFYCIGGSGGV